MEKETFISKKSIEEMLSLSGPGARDLREKAARVRDECVGRKVYFRGLIEFSNICSNDCFYCGIRNSNSKTERYTMTPGEIMECVRFCDESGYGSVVLQSGERRDGEFTGFVTETVSAIKSEFPEMRITLSVGEQDRETLRRFYEAGAERYLLRIETSNSSHYRKLHPEKMVFENRRNCLETLRRIGFQVGTGVMIASPYQEIADLAGDLLFMKAIDIDMVGMGPYLPQKDNTLKDWSYDPQEALRLSLNMIAVLRIMMPDINIAATSALQVLDENGREKAIASGANIVMPNVTPLKYRQAYSLYDNRPCVLDTPYGCYNCITQRIEGTGLLPAKGEKGDSLRFLKRKGKRIDVCNC